MHCSERLARASPSEPTSAQVTSGVVAKPSRRTLGCTRATAAPKSAALMARPDRSPGDSGARRRRAGPGAGPASAAPAGGGAAAPSGSAASTEPVSGWALACRACLHKALQKAQLAS